MLVNVKRLDKRGVATAVEWARLEGWNPGLSDPDAFYGADPNGFWGAFADGELGAAISTVGYGGRFAFVGLYICRPDLRGRGLGLRLWTEALASIEAESIGLDGVPAQQHNYAKSGFVLAHRNIRLGGDAPRGVTAGHQATLRVLGPSNVAAILAFERERRLFPAPREAFLRAWIGAAGTSAFGIDRNSGLSGYGAIRPCHRGYKIGPLFAESPADARSLVTGLLASVPAGPIFLDVPEPNGAAIALARSLGLAPVFETARMYRGSAPDLDLSKIFGITSFELG